MVMAGSGICVGCGEHFDELGCDRLCAACSAPRDSPKQFGEKELREKWPKARGDLWNLESWLCFDYFATSQQLNVALKYADQAFARLTGQAVPVNSWTAHPIHTVWASVRAQLKVSLEGNDDPRLSDGQLEMALYLADQEIARVAKAPAT